MSDITRFDIRCLAVTKRENGDWVRYEDHLAVVERLKAERDQMATHPRGRDVGRFGLDGHYLDAMEPTRPTDEDIWREAFITMLPSYPWEKAAEKSDCVLVEYRKRWPR